MSWLRLYITVEGPTEKRFADQALTPHLANYNIEVKPRVVLTNRKLGKRGGILDFDKIRGDLMRLMKQDQHPEARFTTMIDLYALPPAFPGWDEARKQNNSLDRVETLEKALHAEFPDPRFHPHIQLHEFEALLFCELGERQSRLANSAWAITALQKETAHLEPEEINEGPHTAPSKRIIHHLPIYERAKVRVGAPAAAAIGLPVLREKCPHFAQWLARLEKLA